MTREDQDGRVAELEDEVERLRAELEDRDRQQARLARSAVGLGGRLLLGPHLRSSFKTWLEAKSLRDPLPAEETADVLAAIIRRVVRVGIVGVLLAVLPGGFLVWQNLLIRSQIEQQAADTLIVRRAQLLATIYEEECITPAEIQPGSRRASETNDAKVQASESLTLGKLSMDMHPIDRDQASLMYSMGLFPKEICRPRAHARARKEAVHAFSEIERNREVELDLSHSTLARLRLTGADLSGAKLQFTDLARAMLFRADLRKASLFRADLTGTNFTEADLTEADLSKANLQWAFLAGADLTGVKLVEANLTRTVLLNANLSGADLVEANLSGANLAGAHNLTQEQINHAMGDADTLLPRNLTRPDHWSIPSDSSGPNTDPADVTESNPG